MTVENNSSRPLDERLHVRLEDIDKITLIVSTPEGQRQITVKDLLNAATSSHVTRAEFDRDMSWRMQTMGEQAVNLAAKALLENDCLFNDVPAFVITPDKAAAPVLPSEPSNILDERDFVDAAPMEADALGFVKAVGTLTGRLSWRGRQIPAPAPPPALPELPVGEYKADEMRRHLEKIEAYRKACVNYGHYLENTSLRRTVGHYRADDKHADEQPRPYLDPASIRSAAATYGVDAGFIREVNGSATADPMALIAILFQAVKQLSEEAVSEKTVERIADIVASRNRKRRHSE